ncbi:MAG: hypothetical protein ACHQK8_09500, partial [Bacteroidia bacterium]
SKNLFLQTGVDIFNCLNSPKVFNDIISNYYQGSNYTGGQGFGLHLMSDKIQMSFNLGFEFRIPFKK